MDKKQKIENRRKNNRFMNYVDISIDEVSETSAICSVVIEEKHLNPGGIMHGGVGLTIADVSAGSCFTYFDKRVVTLDLNYKFLQAVKLGDKLVAISEVLKVGRTTAVAKVDLKVGEKLVGYCVASFYILDGEN